MIGRECEARVKVREDFVLFDATIPSSIQALLVSFSPCFSRPGFENFVALVTGWIACQGRHCITRVIQAARGPARTKHHSALYRFFSKGTWEADSLGAVLFGLLLPFLPKKITLILDDTLCHRSGPRHTLHRSAALSTLYRSSLLYLTSVSHAPSYVYAAFCQYGIISLSIARELLP